MCLMENISNQFDYYRRENFKKLGLVAFVIYTLLAFVDYSLLKKNLSLLLVLRIIFITPTALASVVIDRFPSKFTDAFIFSSFFIAAMGVSLISYLLGGISSDYYFGIIIISFVQYSFVPIKFKYLIIFDLAIYFLFFSVNTIPFNYESAEIIKQSSNYWSFSILKLVLASKSEGMLKDALKKTTLEKELEGKKKFQLVLGELLHLLNNPLFISMGLVQRLNKEEDLSPENQAKLEKIQEANFRMEKVLKKIRDVRAAKGEPESHKDFQID